METNSLSMQNDEYKYINEEAMNKITQLGTKIELMEFEKLEMRNAFDKI